MWRLILYLAVVLPVTRARSLAFDCPRSVEASANKTWHAEGCSCELDLQMYACPAKGMTTPIVVHVQCQNPVSLLHTASHAAVGLDLAACTLQKTLAGVSPVKGIPLELSISLDRVRGEILREHVQGLPGVEQLVMTHAADQDQIPFDVLDSLPTLKEYWIDGARLTLEASGGDVVAPHSALRTVALTRCGIVDVPPGAFIRLGNIKGLNLNGNKIVNFSSDAFTGLKNLKALSLSGNPLTSLPSHSFEFIPRLRTLYLDETRLATVPGDAFKGLQSLKQITFKNGKETMKFGARALAALPALKELIIKSTPLKPLPFDLLENSTALEEITITDSGIELIPKGLLITQQHLKKLDLSGNKIKMLDDNFFTPIKALYELNLDRNYIEKFPNNLFAGLSKLKSVSANHNRLNYIGETAFRFTNSLEFISLNDNRLAWESFQLKHDMLDFAWHLTELKELHLQGNHISTVVPIWKTYQQLKKLDLSKNNFTELTESDFDFQARDLVIDFRHNHITNVVFSTGSQNEAERTTIHVLLDKNPYECNCQLYKFVKRLHQSKQHVLPLKLDPEYAQCASPLTLKGILLQNLQLPSLTCSLSPQDCPANCTCDIRPASRTLELDCETEQSLYPDPENHGQNTTQLRLRSIQSLALPSHVVSLNLTGLGLSEPPSLKLLQNVQHLDLSRNYLTSAPVELFKGNMSLRLTGNPFACDCSNLDNVFDLLDNADRFDASNVTCSGGKSLMNIDPEKLCEVRKGAILGGALAIIGLIVAITTGIAYRQSLKIKVFLFSRGWCRSWIEEDDLDDESQYDAFVSFSQEDAKWVAEELLPKLEGEPNNFNLCVHYRDWVVGDMIPTQIATSVELSRRTIVVLKKNFLESTWAPLEFRAANIRAQRERRARVLIVVLGDVPDCEDMDAELRAYLSTNTYLKWGDPWFWEKLMYAMPHKR